MAGGFDICNENKPPTIRVRRVLEHGRRRGAMSDSVKSVHRVCVFLFSVLTVTEAR